MSNENGYKPSGVVVEGLMSGVEVIIQPLSPWGLEMIQKRAVKEFPDPPKDQFMVEIDIAGGRTQQLFDKARQDEYNELLNPVRADRATWSERQLILNFVDTVEPREIILARFSDDLETWRRLAGDDFPADDWEACMLFCVIASPVDKALVIQAMRLGQVVPLKEEELETARASFRLDVSGVNARKLLSITSGIEERINNSKRNL